MARGVNGDRAARMSGGVPDRWKPDLHMVDSVLAMPKAAKKLTELDMPDRCWLVAGLTAHGWTAKRIAEVTGCSERLSKAIRAEPAYQVAMIVHEELKELTERLYAESSEHSNTRRELQLCRAEGDRLRMQFDQLISSHLKGKVDTFRCGHPKSRYNTHRYVDRSGPKPRKREACRECNRERVAKCREKQRQRREQGGNAEALQVSRPELHTDSIASAS